MPATGRCRCRRCRAARNGSSCLSLDDELRATIRQTLEVLGYAVQLASGVEEMFAALRGEDAQLLMVDGLGARTPTC